MNGTPRVGTVGEIKFTVTEAHAIDFADNGMPAVLSTPWLIWFLEHSAREAMLPFLNDGESTVGMVVDVNHLAATPLNHEVTCRGRVLGVNNNVVSFQLEAHDQVECIARGFHKLAVINIERFARRVAKKAS